MPKRQLNLKLPLGFLHPDLYANSTSKSEWVMVLQEQGKTICVALENIYKDIDHFPRVRRRLPSFRHLHN